MFRIGLKINSFVISDDDLQFRYLGCVLQCYNDTHHTIRMAVYILSIVILILLSQSNHLSKLNLIYNWFDSASNVNTHTQAHTHSILKHCSSESGVHEMPYAVRLLVLRTSYVHTLRVRFCWGVFKTTSSNSHVLRWAFLISPIDQKCVCWLRDAAIAERCHDRCNLPWHIL